MSGVSRAERVAAGLDDLDQWLRDQIRGGLAGWEQAGNVSFERVAARLVDAQAPGVAAMVRSIAADGDEGWPERVLHRLAALHLLISAHRGLAGLPAELAANVRSRVGYPVVKAQVLAEPGVADRWLALGKVDTAEGHVQSRRVWLYGTGSGRWALWLTFAGPGGILDATVLPGQQIQALLHFYPGSGFRALVGEVTSGRPAADSPVASATLTQTQQRFAALLALDPWATRLPAVVKAAPIPPREPGQPWRLRDVDGRCVDAVGLDTEPWVMVARSGGEPIEVFGEWGSRGFAPLGLPADARGEPFTTRLTT